MCEMLRFDVLFFFPLSQSLVLSYFIYRFFLKLNFAVSSDLYDLCCSFDL